MRLNLWGEASRCRCARGPPGALGLRHAAATGATAAAREGACSYDLSKHDKVTARSWAVLDRPLLGGTCAAGQRKSNAGRLVASELCNLIGKIWCVTASCACLPGEGVRTCTALACTNAQVGCGGCARRHICYEGGGGVSRPLRPCRGKAGCPEGRRAATECATSPSLAPRTRICCASLGVASAAERVAAEPRAPGPCAPVPPPRAAALARPELPPAASPNGPLPLRRCSLDCEAFAAARVPAWRRAACWRRASSSACSS